MWTSAAELTTFH